MALRPRLCWNAPGAGMKQTDKTRHGHMKVIAKADSSISAFEVYEIVAQELSRIPVSESQLTENELRRKFCSTAVLEQIRKHSVVPSIESLDLTLEGRNALEQHSVSVPTSRTISREKLEELLDKLHR